jgi:small-conductance mechanosensitive channel
MVPFGYHLVPHGPVVRTVTGFVFGLGMMYYLLLVPAEMLGWERLATNRSLMPFVAVALVPLPVIVSTAQYGSAVAGSLLSLLALAGLAVTALLALGNAVALCDRLVAGRQKAPV